MLRGRPALASVLLCCICLPVLTQSSKVKPCTKDFFPLIEKLNSTLSDCKLPVTDNIENSDCRLYTPTIDHVEKCSKSTLDCFVLELKVLVEECNNPLLEILRTLLSGLASHMNDTQTPCPQCECYKTKDVRTFLQALNTTVQMTNSIYCTK